MAAELVRINAAQRPIKSAPVHIFKLRWRITTKNGLTISSSWTPETRYPSFTETMKELEGKIDRVHIDGINIYDKSSITFISCNGSGFKTLSYKSGFIRGQLPEVIGIEVEDVEGGHYLVLRDGNVNVFKPGVTT